MTDTEIAAFAAAGSSLIVALFSGFVALRSSGRTNANSLQIQNLRGAMDRDLETLKARLSHGQIISSTQWNAEFGSYQAIWKGMVPVRTLAMKIVHRERDLVELGVPGEYLASADRLEHRKKLIRKYVEALEVLLLAIHDNAPFYPAPVREAANDTHSAAKSLTDKHLVALTHLAKTGVDITADDRFAAEIDELLEKVVDGVDRVERLIRDRLAAVEVVNNLRA